jgi:glutathione S-transferase
MAIVFYYAPHSSAVRTHWALEELGVPYEGVKLDLKAGDTKRPEFLKLNPNGKVPTLVDGGVIYYESAAINIYLGEKYGVTRGLWPAAGTPGHGLAMSWLVWSAATLLEAAGRIMYNTMPEIPDDLKNAGQAEKGRKDFEALLGQLDAHLDGKPYLTGASFTLADAHVAADMWWYQMGLVPDLGKWPNLKGWVERCMGRPAFKRISGTG